MFSNFDFSIFVCDYFSKVRQYKVPLENSQMVSMTRKSFSDETMKKVHWVRRMYADWRLFRQSQENLRNYSCDLDNLETVNKKDLNEAMC